jgi:ribosomal protein S18 acetylase RimI-like enzyme
VIRPLSPGDVPAAAAMLARAFEEDPLFRWLLPAPARREAWLRWFHTRATRESLSVGGAFCLEQGAHAGVIALVPPGRWPIPLTSVVAATRVPTAFPTPHLVFKGLHVERRMRALHPKTPHVYVVVLGVDPSLKGRGLGGALLRHALKLASDASVPAYLETSKPENVGFYRRHGFEVTGEISSHGGPPLWTLATRSSLQVE